jgi:hypothetical protein
MRKWLLAWAATELTLARLARRFSSLALPDPGPLSASIPIPDADPPEGMELIAVPTGLNKRVAAYAYRGGSVFDRRDFCIGARSSSTPRATFWSIPGSAVTSPGSPPQCRATSGPSRVPAVQAGRRPPWP